MLGSVSLDGKIGHRLQVSVVSWVLWKIDDAVPVASLIVLIQGIDRHWTMPDHSFCPQEFTADETPRRATGYRPRDDLDRSPA
jgi:hypothetical protein